MLDRTNPENRQSAADIAVRNGFLAALFSYLLWGVLPIYMKAVAHIAAPEVVANRVLWSIPTAALVLAFTVGFGEIRAALRSPRLLAMAALTAIIIAVNWGIYVWAVAVGRTVETALGYYINPLVTILLAAVMLGERLTRLQVAAVLLAAGAVLVMAIDAGGLPWVSLSLAFSFAFYGYFRKTVPLGAAPGFLLEVLLLAPLAVAYLVWLSATGASRFLDGWNPLLLMIAGPLTAAPLILYAYGAKRLRLATIGIMQYIAPTLIAANGVFLFGEPFGPWRMAAFGLIWAALALYTWSIFSTRRAG